MPPPPCVSPSALGGLRRVAPAIHPGSHSSAGTRLSTHLAKARNSHQPNAHSLLPVSLLGAGRVPSWAKTDPFFQCTWLFFFLISVRHCLKFFIHEVIKALYFPLNTALAMSYRAGMKASTFAVLYNLKLHI